jgi:hypothetical protein
VQEGVLGIKVGRTLRVTAGHRNEGSEADAAQRGFDSAYFYGTDLLQQLFCAELGDLEGQAAASCRAAAPK